MRTTTDELQRLGLAIAGFLECVAAAATAAYWFLSLDDARLKCEAWRVDYNEVRPHNAIGNQTPIARASASGQAGLT